MRSKKGRLPVAAPGRYEIRVSAGGVNPDFKSMQFLLLAAVDRAVQKPVLIVFLAMGCAVAQSQEAPRELDGDAFEEIQVTATRRPVNAAKVASAITLVPAEEIRILKLTTDALAARPGVFLQQTTPGQGAAIVRGLKGSEVLHLVDGFRLNNAIFRNAPTQYLALISPGTVERIEILRGSAASLYGNDAVGGVLQVINRVPEFSGNDMGYRGEFGLGLDTAELERSVHASLDAGTERLAGLLSLDYLETGNRRTGDGDRIGPSGYTSESARAALSYTPTESASWLFDLQYGRQPNTPRIDELVPGFGETEPASEEFFFAPNERLFAHLRHSRQGGWFGADWMIDLGWQRIVDDRISRNFGSDTRRLEENSSDLYGLTVSASRTAQFGAWVAGAEYYFDDVASQRIEVDVSSGQQDEVRSRFPDDSTVSQAALFANLSLDVSSDQTVTGGARFSFINVDIPVSPFAPAADLDFDDFSADLGWSLDLTEEWQLVANLGYGFRAPNVFDLGTLGERPGNRFNVPNPELESEKITQFDVGLRHRNERWTSELVAWVLSYDDRLTSVLTGAQTPDGRDVVQTQNRASALIWGLESSSQLFLSDRTTAHLILNVVRGEQEEADGSTAPADRIPPVNGRLAIDFAWRDSISIDSYLVFAASQDRLSDRDVRDSRIDPEGTDGWVTANLDLRWQPDEHWTLHFGALNILDEQYRVHGSGLDAPGQNLRVNVRYDW